MRQIGPLLYSVQICWMLQLIYAFVDIDLSGVKTD